MTELFAALINLFVLLFWGAVWITGAGLVLALVVLPIAWVFSISAPPD